MKDLERNFLNDKGDLSGCSNSTIEPVLNNALWITIRLSI